MTGRPGRPRAAQERDTAGAVLRAAAALFSSVGYTATSTYAIAERAGVKQASIYHHFRGKDAILRTLLLGTVGPSLALADHLVALPAGAAARLWALCDADARLLAGGPVNVGALMLLPEVGAGEAFAEFRAQRDLLRARYDALVAAVLADRPSAGSGAGALPGGGGPAAGVLVFGLVESVIAGRREGGPSRVTDVAPLVADAALRVLGLGADAVAAARAEAAGLALPDLASAVDGASSVPGLVGGARPVGPGGATPDGPVPAGEHPGPLAVDGAATTPAADVG
jgi:AcrR family transcriptional regulator